jgi:hypothetical protein
LLTTISKAVAQKVKVKLSLCLTKHHAMKAYWRKGCIVHTFLTSALDGGEWSTSRPGRFTPRERAPGTHWIGGWVGPRAVLDAVVERKIPSSLRVSNPRTSIVQPVTQSYTDWAIAGLTQWQIFHIISEVAAQEISISCLRSHSVLGFLAYTVLFKSPHRLKTNSVKSGVRGGYSTLSLRPIHLPRKRASKKYLVRV